MVLAGNGRRPAVCVVSSHMGTWVCVVYDAVGLAGCVGGGRYV